MNNNANQENNQGNTGKEIVPVDQGLRQQLETTNKFAAFEDTKGDKEENNQLSIVENLLVNASLTLLPSVALILKEMGD